MVQGCGSLPAVGAWHGIELGELTLAGERLTLRPWRPGDADAVYRAMQDPAVHEFLPLPDPYTRADAESFVGDGGEGRSDGTGIGSAVIESATGRLVGAAALRLPAGGRAEADIGYWVARPARGQGYAAEAVRVLAEWAFEHGVVRVALQCDVRNLPSACSALRAGFTFEGIRRRGLANPPGDGALFARLDEDDGEPVRPVLPSLPGGGLRDEAIALRLVQPSDAFALLDERADPEARRWQFDHDPPSAERVTETAARAGLDWLVGPIGRLAIVDLGSGEVAGTISLRQVGPPQIANVGYGLRRSFRGHGFTARALRLVAAWAFDQAGLARLELGAKAANVASQKAALAGGFQPDGVRAGRLRNPDGTFGDEVRYALVNPRYQQPSH